MAEEKKVEEKKVEEKMVAVLNKSVASKHTTSRGPLLPGQSVEVPESEAKRLCGYKHIVLASSVVASVGAAENLKAENVVLRAKVAELEAQLKDLTPKAKKSKAEKGGDE